MHLLCFCNYLPNIDIYLLSAPEKCFLSSPSSPNLHLILKNVFTDCPRWKSAFLSNLWPFQKHKTFFIKNCILFWVWDNLWNNFTQFFSKLQSFNGFLCIFFKTMYKSWSDICNHKIEKTKCRKYWKYGGNDV